MICNLSQLPCTGHGSGSGSDSEDTDIIGHRDSSLACRPRQARHKIQFPKQSRVKDGLGREQDKAEQGRAGHIGMQVANVIIVLGIDIIVSE